MATVAEPVLVHSAARIVDPTLAELAARFGAMPLSRIRMEPYPGTATEADAIRINEQKLGLCELVDGILLEKAMGWFESYLGIEIGRLIGNFVRERNLGIILGEQAMLRLWPGRIRMPDCCYLSWRRMGVFPNTDSATLNMGADLAVEVISPSNTRPEMQQKLEDYFASGARVVWYIYPDRGEVQVYTAADQVCLLKGGEALDGGDVLPGFSIDLKKLFQRPAPG